MIELRFTLAICLFCAASCTKDAPGKKGTEAAERAAAPLAIELSNPQLRFTYLGKDQKFQMAPRASDVPEDSRGAVMVVDLAQTRVDSDLVNVVDLRSLAEKVPAIAMERPAFERLARGLIEKQRPPVIMYATTWCGVCRTARGFLKKHGVAYQEKDIDKDRAAAAELQAKAQKAGVSARGVPVFDVAGKILPGFDEGQLKQLLKL